MRTTLVVGLWFAVGCGGAVEMGPDAGKPDSGAPDAVSVTMTWAYFTAAPYPCATAPRCIPYNKACVGGPSSCFCDTCGSPGLCEMKTQLTEHCCSATVAVASADLGRLANEYSFDYCELAQTGPGTYGLTCGNQPTAYRDPARTLPFTSGCAWGLPYAFH